MVADFYFISNQTKENKMYRVIISSDVYADVGSDVYSEFYFLNYPTKKHIIQNLVKEMELAHEVYKDCYEKVISCVNKSEVRSLDGATEIEYSLHANQAYIRIGKIDVIKN